MKNGAYICNKECICKTCKENNSNLIHHGKCYICRDCYDGTCTTKECLKYKKMR